MDVTPTDPMFAAMSHLCDTVIGTEPLMIETSKAANDRRAKRRLFMDTLHDMVAMSMREGVRRFCEDHMMPTQPGPMKGHDGN